MQSRTITIHFNGSVSWNKIYSVGHWTQRKKITDEWKNMFLEKLKDEPIERYEMVEVDLEVNNRLDIDNSGVMIKFLMDALKSLNFIKDDSPKYFKRMSISVNKAELSTNSGKAVLTLYNNQLSMY